MDRPENASNCGEATGCPEEEEVDPRIQGELEKLNQSTDDINRWEGELEDCRQRFRTVLKEATLKLDEQVKKIGRAVDDSKPYWESRKVVRQAQVEAQNATQEFQRAVEILRAAKETIALAEERLLEEDSRQFDSAWQEMLNHATQRVMEAEQARMCSEAEHKKTAANYNSCIGHMKQLEKKLKRSINKSRPYFELKAKYYLHLEQLKRHVDERQSKLVLAKAEYRAALRNLETISEEIHAQRRSLSMGAREQGVGAEGSGGESEDIGNFKMDSDGLSMVSVSIYEEGSQSTTSEEETETHSTSAPLDIPLSSSSAHSARPCTSGALPSTFPSYASTSFLAASSPPRPPSPLPTSCSSCPGHPELPSPSESPSGPESECDSGHASPLLGPRSQCSGASSPDCDCDQERGERAEGAEATLEPGLNKLTLTLVCTPDTEDEQDSYNAINPDTRPPTPVPTVPLLDSV